MGIKLKDFENTTQEYESDTSPEVSFADVDTVMTSPIKKSKDEELVTELRAENAELKEALKAKEQVPEGCDKALKTCLETKSETVKTATMKKAVEGLLLKNKPNWKRLSLNTDRGLLIIKSFPRVIKISRR